MTAGLVCAAGGLLFFPRRTSLSKYVGDRAREKITVRGRKNRREKKVTEGGRKSLVARGQNTILSLFSVSLNSPFSISTFALNVLLFENGPFAVAVRSTRTEREEERV